MILNETQIFYNFKELGAKKTFVLFVLFNLDYKTNSQTLINSTLFEKKQHKTQNRLKIFQLTPRITEIDAFRSFFLFFASN